MTDFYAGSAAYAAEHGGAGEKTHHLLRHSLAPEERGEGVLIFFSTDSLAEAVKQVKRMSQRDLQAKFREIYGAKTHSNNNNWLRRKLFEAIGVDPAKGAGKKPAGAVQKRRKPPVKAARAAKAPRVAVAGTGMPAAPHEMDHYAAEALLALGEVAWEELSEESAPTASTGTGASSDAAAAPALSADKPAGQHALWCDMPATDRMVPDGSYSIGAATSAFAVAAAVKPGEPQGSAQSVRQEHEGETEPAPAGLFVASPGNRANSTSLSLPGVDAADFPHMASNVGQLYAWLLSRQQQQQLAGLPTPPPGVAHQAPLPPAPHLLPFGTSFGHPLVHSLPPGHISGPLPFGLVPGTLPVAPPLFSTLPAKVN